MNFSSVRGYNAYAQFSVKIREAVKSRAESEVEASKEPEAAQDYSVSFFSEPVDVVTISTPARNASTALMAQRDASAPLAQRRNPAHIEFRDWEKSAKMISGNFSQKIPGSIMNEVLSGNNITVGDDEVYDVSLDVWSAVTVSSKNAEKARAIQDLLNSTPIGINWGLLLARLPPM